MRKHTAWISLHRHNDRRRNHEHITFRRRNNSTIRTGLARFSIDAVARFGDSDIDRLLKNDGMIRSAKKISGVIANAQAMQQVQQEYGSFATYLHAVKAKGEETLLKDLRQRFAFLGESTSIMFLFGVGEEMPQTVQKMQV